MKSHLHLSRDAYTKVACTKCFIKEDSVYLYKITVGESEQRKVIESMKMKGEEQVAIFCFACTLAF